MPQATFDIAKLSSGRGVEVTRWITCLDRLLYARDRDDKRVTRHD